MYATAPAIVALCNPTVGMLWLIAGRMVTGFGSGMSVATQAFFATQTPIAERTEYMGYNRTFVSSDISTACSNFVRAPPQS